MTIHAGILTLFHQHSHLMITTSSARDLYKCQNKDFFTQLLYIFMLPRIEKKVSQMLFFADVRKSISDNNSHL